MLRNLKKDCFYTGSVKPSSRVDRFPFFLAHSLAIFNWSLPRSSWQKICLFQLSFGSGCIFYTRWIWLRFRLIFWRFTTFMWWKCFLRLTNMCFFTKLWYLNGHLIWCCKKQNSLFVRLRFMFFKSFQQSTKYLSVAPIWNKVFVHWSGYQ